MGGLFIIVIIWLVILLVIKAVKAGDTPNSGTLVIPDEPEKVPEEPKKSEILPEAVRIYYCNEPEARGWYCPNCQCENNYSHTNCCVCDYKR